MSHGTISEPVMMPIPMIPNRSATACPSGQYEQCADQQPDLTNREDVPA